MRTKNSFKALPKKNPVEETEGRRLLREIEKGQTEMAREISAFGVPAQQTNIRAWLLGLSRPEAFLRVVLQRVYGIPVEAWLTGAERALLAKVEATLPPKKNTEADLDVLAWPSLHTTKPATH